MSDDTTDPGCTRCGSSTTWVDCLECGGDGVIDCYEEDPLWYDEDSVRPCHLCGGHGGWSICISTPEWCEAHPLPGQAKAG